MTMLIVTFLGMVDQDGLLDNMERQEAANQGDHGAGSVDIKVANKLENFRQNIECHDTEDNAGSIAQNTVEVIFIFECEKAA